MPRQGTLRYQTEISSAFCNKSDFVELKTVIASDKVEGVNRTNQLRVNWISKLKRISLCVHSYLISIKLKHKTYSAELTRYRTTINQSFDMRDNENV